MTEAPGVPLPASRVEACAFLPGRTWLCLAAALLMSAAPAGAQAADRRSMIAEVVRTGSVIVRGISFDKGAEVPSSSSEAALRQVSAMLREHDEWTFEVQVHTDETGDAVQDQALSTARAKGVVAWLTGEGIAPARLVPRGYGSSKPPARTATGESATSPRRLELKKLNEE